jgi:hypothetical protein
MLEIPVEGATGGHAAITADWVASIRTGSPLLAPGIEGIHGLEISNAMHLSSWLERSLELPVDEDVFHAELEKRIQDSRGRGAGGKTGG